MDSEEEFYKVLENIVHLESGIHKCSHVDTGSQLLVGASCGEEVLLVEKEMKNMVGSTMCKDYQIKISFEDLLVEKENDKPPLNIDIETMLSEDHSIGVKTILPVEENIKVYLVTGVATKVFSCGQEVDMSLSAESNMESCIVEIAK